jgi:hypothetical protein
MACRRHGPKSRVPALRGKKTFNQRRKRKEAKLLLRGGKREKKPKVKGFLTAPKHGQNTTRRYFVWSDSKQMYMIHSYSLHYSPAYGKLSAKPPRKLTWNQAISLINESNKNHAKDLRLIRA